MVEKPVAGGRFELSGLITVRDAKNFYGDSTRLWYCPPTYRRKALFLHCCLASSKLGQN